MPSPLSRSRAWSLSLLLALAGLAAPLHADDLADEADVQFELGATKYKSGDFLGALEHFLASNRLVPNKNVLFNIARCYEQLKRYPDAYRAYARALEQGPDPQQKKEIEEALGRIAPKVALLDVKTDPPGATIYLDRKDLGARGEAPKKLGLEPGKVKVIVELAGHESAEKADVVLTAGTTTTINLVLVPILGTIEVTGEPAGATVHLDKDTGPAACVLPCTLSAAPGKHTLIVEKEGWKRADVSVEARPKQNVPAKVKLDRISGSVVVSADVSESLIEVDGKPVGFTPSVVQVPVGPHVMIVSRSGFRAVKRNVMVTETGQAKVDVSLTEVSEVNAASRASESVEEAPSSVSIVPSAELRGMMYPTVAEALRGVRGLYVADDRTYVALGFRGFFRPGDYGNRVLVLVDGHPTNDDWSGSSYVGFDARTDIDDVERIEVVRGPGSVLYGTGAFFGVVNLVTRSRGAPTRVEGAISTVEYGVSRARASANLRLGPDTGVWTSFAVAQGAGRDFFFPEVVGPGVDGVARDLDGFRSGTISGRFYHQDFTVQWFFTQRKKTLPTGAYGTVFGSDGTTIRDTRSFVEARFEPKIGDTLQSFTRLHANLYDYRGTSLYERVDGGEERDTFRGHWVGFEQRFVVSPVERLRLTLGGEVVRHFLVRQKVENETGLELPERSDPFTVAAGYLLADLSLGRFKLSAGARADWYSTVGLSLNPRLALIGKPWTDGVVKLVAGRAFRAPSAYELYYSSTTQKTPETLTPETVWSGELEVSQRFSPTVVLTGAFFGNYVKDLVKLVGGGTEADPNVYVNSTVPVFTYGFEAELRRDFRDGWMVAAQGSIQRARYADNASGLREVPGAPPVLVGLRGAVPILPRALLLSTRVSYVAPMWDRNDEASDPAQARTEAGVIWDLVFTGEAERGFLRYALGIYNVLDWRTTMPVSREYTQRALVQAGRTLLASASFSY